ncbi:MAG: hypothetical protein WDM96_06465 [Lacunisphaera sp.]
MVVELGPGSLQVLERDGAAPACDTALLGFRERGDLGVEPACDGADLRDELGALA